jgi:hypothetical protein
MTYSEHKHKALSTNNWVSICKCLTEAVLLSLSSLDFSDDEEQTRAIQHVGKAFNSCSLSGNSFDIKLNDAPSVESAPTMTSSNDSLLSSLCQMQVSFELGLEAQFSSHLVQLELCRKAPLQALFFDFLTKSCVAMVCSPLVPKGQVPCGAISIFSCFFNFGLPFLYSGHFLMVVDI